MAASPCLLRGPKRGWKCYVTPTPSAGRKIRSGPEHRGEKLKWLPHPCLLRGPQEGVNDTSPLHSRGSPIPSAGRNIRGSSQQRVNENRSGCLNPPCLLGGQKKAEMLPNAKRRMKNQKWSRTQGRKNRSGCRTPAFSGAQKRVEMLCHPCMIGDPQRQARGGKSEVAPNKGEQNWK